MGGSGVKRCCVGDKIEASAKGKGKGKGKGSWETFVKAMLIQ